MAEMIYDPQSGSYKERQEFIQVSENSGRLAHSFATYKTDGAGEIVVEELLEFECVFVEEPLVSFGAQIIDLPDEDYYGYPRVTGGVYRWEFDDQDHYIGCFVYFTVDIPIKPPPPESSDEERLAHRQHIADNAPTANINHHLTFRGVAYKDIPDDILETLYSGESIQMPDIYELLS